MLHQKQRHLKESVTSRKIKVSCHDVQTSFLEGVFARGDRCLGKSARMRVAQGLQI